MISVLRGSWTNGETDIKDGYIHDCSLITVTPSPCRHIRKATHAGNRDTCVDGSRSDRSQDISCLPSNIYRALFHVLFVIPSLNPFSNTIGGGVYFYSHFTDGKTEAQKVSVTCPRLPSSSGRGGV